MLKFLRNMRIKSQINDAEREFKSLSTVDRAYATLMAAEFMSDLEKANAFYAGVLLRPYAFSPEECYQVYWETEALKLYAEKSIRSSLKLRQEWGISDDNKDHGQLKYAGLVYWMIRVATNVDKDLHEKAMTACKRLVHNIEPGDFDDAIDRLNEVIAVGESMGQSALGSSVEVLRKRAEELINDHGC